MVCVNKLHSTHVCREHNLEMTAYSTDDVNVINKEIAKKSSNFKPIKKIQEKIENMKFAYHGNHGGPNYGDPNVPPVDKLDSLFKKHDEYYTKGAQDVGDKNLIGDLAQYLTNSENYPYPGINALKALLAQGGFGLKQMAGLSEPTNETVNDEKIVVNDPEKITKVINPVVVTKKQRNKLLHSYNGNSSMNNKKQKKLKSVIKQVKNVVKKEKKFKNNFTPATSIFTVKTRPHFKMTNHMINGSPAITIKGKDILTRMEPNAMVADKMYRNVPLGPSMLPNSRLRRFSELYERYRVNDLYIEFQPNLGTATTGSIVSYIDLDSTDKYTDGFVDKIMENPSAIASPINQRFFVKRAKSKQDLWVRSSTEPGTPTKADDRMSLAGQFLVFGETTENASWPGTTSSWGVFWVHYSMTFFIPAFEGVISGPYYINRLFDYGSGIAGNLTIGTDFRMMKTVEKTDLNGVRTRKAWVSDQHHFSSDIDPSFTVGGMRCISGYTYYIELRIHWYAGSSPGTFTPDVTYPFVECIDYTGGSTTVILPHERGTVSNIAYVSGSLVANKVTTLTCKYVLSGDLIAQNLAASQSLRIYENNKIISDFKCSSSGGGVNWSRFGMEFIIQVAPDIDIHPVYVPETGFPTLVQRRTVNVKEFCEHVVDGVTRKYLKYSCSICKYIVLDEHKDDYETKDHYVHAKLRLT